MMNINAPCGQGAELQMFEQAVHIVTIMLKRLTMSTQAFMCEGVNWIHVAKDNIDGELL